MNLTNKSQNLKKFKRILLIVSCFDFLRQKFPQSFTETESEDFKKIPDLWDLLRKMASRVLKNFHHINISDKTQMAIVRDFLDVSSPLLLLKQDQEYAEEALDHILKDPFLKQPVYIKLRSLYLTLDYSNFKLQNLSSYLPGFIINLYLY